ncbi:hypothetical protein Trydic_g20955 [Trypoxylus dichotomus]
MEARIAFSRGEIVRDTMGVFPTDSKKAYVIPIPQNRIPVSSPDLRAISILPVPLKILEKIIDRQSRSHLSILHLLPTIQSGFHP